MASEPAPHFLDELAERFPHRGDTPGERAVRYAAYELAVVFAGHGGDGRELDNALDRLEEALGWCLAGLRREQAAAPAEANGPAPF